jgi:dipeptidase E
MKINFLFSGINIAKGFNLKQIEYLKKYIHNQEIITFIAASFNDYQNNDRQIKALIKFFNQKNITFSKINVIDNRITKEIAKQMIKETNIVFLMGGDPEEQMQNINKYELSKLLKRRDGLTIGISAGSMNQAEHVIDKEDDGIHDYKGFGLAKINIYPHLDFNNLAYLNEIKEVSKLIDLYALPNDSFIVIENEKPTFVGEYYQVSNANFLKNINK